MKAKTTLIAVGVLTLSAIVSALAISRQCRSTDPTPAGTRRFQVHGQIRSLEIAERTIRVAHDEIPGYMPAMTMPLAVKDAALFRGLSAGDDVQFELVVTADDSWISRIEKVPANPAAETAGDTKPAQEAELARIEPGETMPDFSLMDQNGRQFQLSDFRGKAVVLTFIYTRCPLPNFCPLMSANFAELQRRLRKDFPDRYQLLSVSLDPQFDRPPVLKEYAARYHVDAERWTFATGTGPQIDSVAKLVGLFHEWENGLISHDLRTALIGPDGRLVHVWKSNAWTPFEVQRRVKEILTDKPGIASR